MDSTLKVEKSLLIGFMIVYNTQQINSNLCGFFLKEKLQTDS